MAEELSPMTDVGKPFLELIMAEILIKVNTDILIDEYSIVIVTLTISSLGVVRPSLRYGIRLNLL